MLAIKRLFVVPGTLLDILCARKTALGRGGCGLLHQRTVVLPPVSTTRASALLGRAATRGSPSSANGRACVGVGGVALVRAAAREACRARLCHGTASLAAEARLEHLRVCRSLCLFEQPGMAFSA